MATSDKSASRFNNHLCYSLDSHANVCIFRNAALLKNIRKVKPITIEGVGGMKSEYSLVGTHDLFGDVIYSQENKYNIISLPKLRNLGYKIRISDCNNYISLLDGNGRFSALFELDEDDGFYKAPFDKPFDPSTVPKVVFSDANTAMLANGRKALASVEDKMTPERFVQELASMIRADNVHSKLPAECGASRMPGSQAMPASVIKNEDNVFETKMYFTQEQQERASQAVALHKALGHPSDAALIVMLKSPSLVNCPLTASDLANARTIYGPCPECMEGKPQHVTGTNSSLETFDIRASGQWQHMDVVFIAGTPHLFSVDHYSGFMILIRLQSKQVADVQSGLLSVINFYRGLKVTTRQSFSPAKNFYG